MRKTKKSISKRFKITGRGKVLRRTPGRRHLMSAKSTKQKRQSGSYKAASAGVSRNVLKSMPYG